MTSIYVYTNLYIQYSTLHGLFAWSCHDATTIMETVWRHVGKKVKQRTWQLWNLRSAICFIHAVQAALNTTAVKSSPSYQKGNSRNTVYFDINCILTMCHWSNLLISHNYHQMGQFQVGCAIKTGVRLTAVVLDFSLLGDFLATYVFFFNSKMAWQQLRSHIRNELRHWYEQRMCCSNITQLSYTFCPT